LLFSGQLGSRGLPIGACLGRRAFSRELVGGRGGRCLWDGNGNCRGWHGNRGNLFSRAAQSGDSCSCDKR